MFLGVIVKVTVKFLKAACVVAIVKVREREQKKDQSDSLVKQPCSLYQMLVG